MLALKLRWALRDARARWVQVAGIALMIAIGTGMYAGLSSVTQWRFASNDASLALTNMYDVRAQPSGDGFLPQGALASIARGIDGVEAVNERLISETQVEVDTDDGPLFVRGRIVGVDMSGGGPSVNGVVPLVGRDIEGSEIGEPVVLVERNFGVYYGLPDDGELKIGGGVSARYVGQGVSPEYFLIVEEGSFFGQANLAVLFTSLETAQRLSGREGLVNDLVLTVEPGTDIDGVEAALLAETAARHPETGLDLMRTEDDASYLALTRDPEGDQAFYNVFALVLFAGAAFASLNFAARMVETQRREIGTSMALGANPLAIAVRPLLVGIQIAVLGVVFGVGIGLLIASLMQGVLEAFVPLPVFVTPFQTGIFAGVAAIGFVLPIVAVLWPVFRAVRVQPVDAIRTGHLAARGGGLAPAISRLPLPGSSLGRMPFRNLLRAPRRTVLTLFALTAVLAILVSLIGMTDSMLSTLVKGDEELLKGVPDRLVVRLDSIYAVDSPEVRGVVEGGALGIAEPGIALGGSVKGAGESLAVLLQFLDLEGGAWRPTVVEGDLSAAEPGIVLARKAAADLGVGAGDSVTLTLPVRTGPVSFSLSAISVPVIAVHPHPLRFNAYMDIRHAGQAGLEGVANIVTGAPASGQTLNDAKRALFGSPGVATVLGIAETSQAAQDIFEEFTAIFVVIQMFVLGLALLIAFNTANINSDERARDHATMFAYGVPVRRVLGNLAVEGLVLGTIATLLGVVLGYGMLLWLIHDLIPASYPDLGVILSVRAPQMAVLLAAGIAVVAFAPVLTVRKLRRMDVPSTLRVLE